MCLKMGRLSCSESTFDTSCQLARFSVFWDHYCRAASLCRCGHSVFTSIYPTWLTWQFSLYGHMNRMTKYVIHFLFKRGVGREVMFFLSNWGSHELMSKAELEVDERWHMLVSFMTSCISVSTRLTLWLNVVDRLGVWTHIHIHQ